MVDEGYDIIVAGHAFGCGSSREEAPRAIKGAGVKAVIARSFAFIYSRNQPSLALLGIVILDDKFYEGQTEGTNLTIDLGRKVVERQDTAAVFPFQLSTIEEALVTGGGVGEMYKQIGVPLFRLLLQKNKRKTLPVASREAVIEGSCSTQAAQLAW